MAIAAEQLAALTWTLGDKIAKARRYAGLEQDELGAAVGVSRALVSKWERDKSEPTISQVRLVAQATGVSFDWLTTIGYRCMSPLHSVSDGDDQQMWLMDRTLEVPDPPVLATV